MLHAFNFFLPRQLAGHAAILDNPNHGVGLLHWVVSQSVHFKKLRPVPCLLGFRLNKHWLLEVFFLRLQLEHFKALLLLRLVEGLAGSELVLAVEPGPSMR